MTDTLPPIAPVPADLPADTKSTLAAQYAKAGYRADQLAAAGYSAMPSGQSVPPANTPTAIQMPGSDVRIAPGPSDGLSPDQRLSGYKALLKFTADPEAVIAAAERDGIPRAQLTAQPADPAAIAAADREAAMQGAFAASDPGGYALTWPRDFAEARDAGTLAALDKETRVAFATATVPAAMAQGLLEAVIDIGAIYESGMSDVARELRWKEEGAMFKKLSADPDDDARLAALAYSRLPKSYRDQLDKKYALHSARAQLTLAGIGRAIEYREARRKT